MEFVAHSGYILLFSVSTDIKNEPGDDHESGNESSSTSETIVSKKQLCYDTASETDSQVVQIATKRKAESQLDEDMLYGILI